MKSKSFNNPTIILITDRTDLDDQLSGQFTNAKAYIGNDFAFEFVQVEDKRRRRNFIYYIKEALDVEDWLF